MIDQATLLERYRLFLLKIAWERGAKTKEEAEDLAQEGWIAMWKASQNPPSHIPLHNHLVNKARWRMAEVVDRGTYTGKPSAQGRKHTEGTKSNGQATPYDPTTSFAEDNSDVDSFVMEGAVLAYHHGEIVAAINTLPPHQRQKVYDRFWRQQYDSDNSAWWYARRIGAKDRLKEHLGHLESLLERQTP